MAVRISTTQFKSGTIDLPFLGEAMLTNPTILRDIVQDRWANEIPILNLFMQLGLSDQEEVLNNHAVRWQIYGAQFPPTFIISVSNATPAVGVDFDIELKNGWFKNGAHLRLSRLGHNIVINNDGERTPRGVRYKAQYIGNNTASTVPAGVLVAGQRVSFTVGVYGEASEKGHPIRFATGDHYVNVSTIMRTDADITGSAAVNPNVEALIYKDSGVDANGEPYDYAAALPMFYKNGKPLLLAQLIGIEKQLLYGVGNFNPINGDIYNTDQRGEVLQLGDGFYQQLQGAAKSMNYSLREPIESFVAKMEAMLQFIKRHTGVSKPTIYAVTGDLGLARLREGARYLNDRNGVQVHVNVSATGERLVDGGLTVGSLVTDYGTIIPVENLHANSEDSPFPRVNHRGTQVSLEAGYITFMFKRPEGTKSNIRTYSVGGTFQGQPINRSLVFKNIPGLSGWGSRFQGSFENATGLTSDMAATGADKISYLTLSEKMLIITNPAEFGIMYATA